MAEAMKTVKKLTNLETEKARGKEMVRGIFHFWEVPGGVLEFNYKAPYKKEPVEFWSFTDGEERKVPLRIAQHLNTTGKVPEHSHVQTPDGRNIVKISRVTSRYGFESTDFVPIEEIGDSDPVSPLYSVDGTLK